MAVHVEEAENGHEQDAEGEREELCADAEYGAEEALVWRKAEHIVRDELPAVVLVVHGLVALVVVAREVIAQDSRLLNTQRNNKNHISCKY